MKKTGLISRQKRKFIFFNLLAFATAFFVIGGTALFLMEDSFYRNPDKELQFNSQILINDFHAITIKGPMESHIRGMNPRIFVLIYDQEFRLIYRDTPNDFNFNLLGEPDATQKYNTQINGFNYRVYDFYFLHEGNLYYATLCLNIDGEINLRNTIIQIYLFCLAAIIVLAVSISILLSHLTMIPITNSLIKQSQFVNDASHELRTPLTVLGSQLEHLLSDPNKTIMEKSEDIGSCLAEVIRLRKLSDNLLTLAKSDADKVPLDITHFDLAQLINKVATPYIEVATLENKTFTIDATSLFYRGDQKQIMQVLVILFDNAIKYTKSGDQIKVKLAKVKGGIELSVTDTGIGISHQGIKRVFERFYRDDTSRGVVDGSGLGLSIAKQIIENHHGAMEINHHHPKGIRVSVFL